MTPEEQRQKHIDFDRNYCTHYAPQPGLAGLNKDNCALGCNSGAKMKLARSSGEPSLAPCIGGHLVPNVHDFCPKWERRSMEHAEKRADDIEKALSRMDLVDPVVNKWRTWSPTNRVSKQGVIECPACKGKLHLAQSSFNGHVHAQCETEDCVSWME